MIGQSYLDKTVFTLRALPKGRKMGEDGRGIHTGHKTSARAARNAKNLCIKLVPFEKGGQTVWGKMSK